MGVDPVHKLRCVPPSNVQLAEGGYIDYSYPLPDRFDLLLRRAVGMGAFPFPHLHHVAPHLHMPVVDGGKSEGHVSRAGEGTHGHRLYRGAGGGAPRLADGLAGFFGTDADVGLQAHLTLAGAHGDGAVPLQGLDIVEAFSYGIVDILLGNVLTDAYELLFGWDRNG